jgi:hypothetical protein
MQRPANIISYRILLYLLCSRLQIHDQNQFELIKSGRARARHRALRWLLTFANQPANFINIFTERSLCVHMRSVEQKHSKIFTALLFRPNCYYMVLYHGHISLAIIGLAGCLVGGRTQGLSLTT